MRVSFSLNLEMCIHQPFKQSNADGGSDPDGQLTYLLELEIHDFFVSVHHVRDVLQGKHVGEFSLDF